MEKLQLQTPVLRDEERSLAIPGAEIEIEGNLWTITAEEITPETRDTVLFEAARTGKPYSLLDDTSESLVIQFFPMV